MSLRHHVKTAFGSILVIAILATPGVASAQSLFGTPPPDTASTPPAASPPAPAKAKKPIAKKARSPVAARASDTSSTDASSTPPAKAPVKKAVAKKRPTKPAPPKAVAKINIANDRAATLVELSVTSTTVKDAKPQIVAHNLKTGQKISAPLAKKGGCIYDVSGTFDDQSTVAQSAVDFCDDANLDLIE